MSTREYLINDRYDDSSPTQETLLSNPFQRTLGGSMRWSLVIIPPEGSAISRRFFLSFN